MKRTAPNAAMANEMANAIARSIVKKIRPRKETMIKSLKAILTASLLCATPAFADYPEREVLGVVMWGAGGATDTVARAVNPAAEAALGKPIVVLGSWRTMPLGPHAESLIPRGTNSHWRLSEYQYHH